MNAPTLALGMPGTVEMIIIAVIALVIFGRRLPDVARSVGKSIVEFKKGLREVKDDIEDQSRLPPPKQPRIEAKPPVGMDSSAGGGASSVPAQSGSSASNTPDAPTSQ